MLLAEDSLFHQKLAVRLLKKQGHRVTVAENGREVLAALEDGRFDLVLMDVEMPELDGLTTTRLIRTRENENLERVAIVALTSCDNRHECLEAGMDAFLAKPLNSVALEHALRMVIGRPDARP